jgi:hypothetical protein
VPELNAKERSVLQLAKEFSEMVQTKWWREYCRILDAQIKDRETLLLLPVSEKHPKFDGMDFQTRAVSLETIKGAVIALRLAKAIPDATIAHAKDIIADHAGVDEDAA